MKEVINESIPSIDKARYFLTDDEIKKEAEIISRSLFNPRKCILCRKNFAITLNLPRILVQCGHSICSLCIA